MDGHSANVITGRKKWKRSCPLLKLGGVTGTRASGLLLVGSVLLSLATTALAYEEPAYRVVDSRDGYELRRYEPYLVAETTVQGTFDDTGNRAFRRLAGYIFGANRAPDAAGVEQDSTPGEPVEMAMTIPVTRQWAADEDGGGGVTYRFVMERGYRLETLPIPESQQVELREIPAQHMAALRYSGRATDSNYQRALATLRERLQADALEEIGEPQFAVYNGPFTLPFLRRNEVLIPIRWPDGGR